MRPLHSLLLERLSQTHGFDPNNKLQPFPFESVAEARDKWIVWLRTGQWASMKVRAPALPPRGCQAQLASVPHLGMWRRLVASAPAGPPQVQLLQHTASFLRKNAKWHQDNQDHRAHSRAVRRLQMTVQCAANSLNLRRRV